VSGHIFLQVSDQVELLVTIAEKLAGLMGALRGVWQGLTGVEKIKYVIQIV
jgi:hypothetical protein